MATASEAAKICVHCRQDCSGKPRTKDAQGRYMCKGCVEALKANAAAAPTRPAPKKAVAVAPPMADDSVLATLLTDSPEPCSACSAPLPKGAVICNFCGFNKESGQATRTRVLKAPREKKEKGPRQRRQSFVLEPLHVGGVLICLQVAMFFACIFNPLFVIPMYAVTGACALAGAVMFICYAIADGGLLWLCAGFIPGVGQLLALFYVFFISERGHLKAVFLANIVGSLLAGAALTGIVAGELEEEAERAQRSGITAPE
jgi:hypothetical protein